MPCRIVRLFSHLELALLLARRLGVQGRLGRGPGRPPRPPCAWASAGPFARPARAVGARLGRGRRAGRAVGGAGASTGEQRAPSWSGSRPGGTDGLRLPRAGRAARAARRVPAACSRLVGWGWQARPSHRKGLQGNGLWQRFRMIFSAKANKALDRAEDPNETLDYSYQKMLELQQKVRRGVADVATSRKRLEIQMTQLQQGSDKLTDPGADGARSGPRGPRPRGADPQERPHRPALRPPAAARAAAGARRRSSRWPPSGCRPRSRPSAPARRRSRRPTTPPRRRPRSTRPSPASPSEMGDVGLAIQRAEDKTAQMQARSGAIDELIASGALEDRVGGGGDDIDRELAAMSSTSAGRGRAGPAQGRRPAAAGHRQHPGTAGHRRRRARRRPRQRGPARRPAGRGAVEEQDKQ